MTPEAQPVKTGTVAALTFSQLAKPFEGFRASPYQDSVGVWTIGYGSTRDALGNPVSSSTAPLTEAQATALAERDLGASVASVERLVTVPLTVDEEVALTDFVYNLGLGNFESSTLLKLLNQGDFEGAANEIDKWDHAGGQVLAGLLRRRQAETALFNTH